MEITKFVLGSIGYVIYFFDPGRAGFSDPAGPKNPVAKLIFGIFEILVLAIFYIGLYFQLQNWWKPILYVLGGYGTILLLCIIIDLIILVIKKIKQK